MRCRFLPAVLLLSATLTRAAPVYGDVEDKILHALFGASCALFASAIATPLLAADSDPEDNERDALLTAGIGLGAALAFGLLKEALDLAGYGDSDRKDLAAAGLGGLAASTAVLTLSLNFGVSPRAGALGGGYACFGVVLAVPVGQSLFRRLRGYAAP
jgi:hypothetical protein